MPSSRKSLTPIIKIPIVTQTYNADSGPPVAPILHQPPHFQSEWKIQSKAYTHPYDEHGLPLSEQWVFTIINTKTHKTKDVLTTDIAKYLSPKDFDDYELQYHKRLGDERWRVDERHRLSGRDPEKIRAASELKRHNTARAAAMRAARDKPESRPVSRDESRERDVDLVEESGVDVRTPRKIPASRKRKSLNSSPSIGSRVSKRVASAKASKPTTISALTVIVPRIEHTLSESNMEEETDAKSSSRETSAESLPPPSQTDAAPMDILNHRACTLEDGTTSIEYLVQRRLELQSPQQAHWLLAEEIEDQDALEAYNMDMTMQASRNDTQPRILERYKNGESSSSSVAGPSSSRPGSSSASLYQTPYFQSLRPSQASSSTSAQPTSSRLQQTILPFANANGFSSRQQAQNGPRQTEEDEARDELSADMVTPRKSTSKLDKGKGKAVD